MRLMLVPALVTHKRLARPLPSALAKASQGLGQAQRRGQNEAQSHGGKGGGKGGGKDGGKDGQPSRSAAHPFKTLGAGPAGGVGSSSDPKTRAKTSGGHGAGGHGAGEHGAGEHGPGESKMVAQGKRADKEEGDEKKMTVLEAALMNAGGSGALTQLERRAGRNSGMAAPAAGGSRASSPPAHGSHPSSPTGLASPIQGRGSASSIGRRSPTAGVTGVSKTLRHGAHDLLTADSGVHWEQEEEDE